ncbi:ACP S-malonyltransferase [Chromobacterium vaccinii]|uniref:ACP S-malonyltransferase n=1 Tax=Chromobacterium vaccinii TaxID=1108595 RepID=UPI000618272B|nr:ACP S-malonyltransferase [Chromobacterium vaccinii]
MKVFMFPGQGSQYKGMGGDLFDGFKDLADKADGILGYSLRELCIDDPRGELNQTRFTQPALYVVNALSYFRKLEEGSGKPDFLAGHSLGEFNALMAAGCYDFETGLKLVQKRGELMGEVSNGAMAAIVNAGKEEIESALAENGLSNVFIANYNTPSQIVISGQADEIARAEQLFQRGKMRYYPLNTSGAFHTRFMLPAKEAFSKFLKQFKFAKPQIPVIANYSARPYEDKKVADTLSRQIASTVRWSESIQYLLETAAERGQDAAFEEMGAGDVLTRLVYGIKQQMPASTGQAAEKPAEEAAQAEQSASGQAKESAADKVAAWNRGHPIGSKVKTLMEGYPELETRTEAMVLFGHRAAVYMKGYNGYFDLDEVSPA